MRHPFASVLLSEVAPSLGIGVELEPEYGFVGELVFPNGKRHVFRNTNFNLNPAGSTEIAKDKQYTSYFLRKHGLKVPESKAFFSDRLNANLPGRGRRSLGDALAYAKELGFPVYLKPNNLSQGELVVKVRCPDQLLAASSAIFSRTDVMVVQQPLVGSDYRVVVLKGEVISAYRRSPLQVVGDGSSSIEELLLAARSCLADLGRPNTDIDPSDFRIDLRLAASGLSRSSVPPANEVVLLLDNANLSTGGSSEDITDRLHPEFASIAIQASECVGLGLCGVDIIASDLSLPQGRQEWGIIELNAAPGLDNYASAGPLQLQRVKDLYRKILLCLAE